MRRSHHLFYRSQLLSLKLDMAVFIPHRIQSATEPCSPSTNLILGRKDSWEHWPIKWLAELYTSASKMIRDCIVSLGEIACAKEQSQMKRFKPGSWRRALDWLVRSPSAMPSVLSRLFSLSADYSRTEKSPLSRFSASPLDHPTSSIAPMPPPAPGAHPDLGHSQFCVGWCDTNGFGADRHLAWQCSLLIAPIPT